jgi:hypothetical protein
MMSFSITASEPAFNLTRWGNIPKLTHVNYDEWKDGMIFILSAMRAYAIVTRDDPGSQPLDLDHNDNYDDGKAKEAEAARMIRFSCSHEVRGIVMGMGHSLEMWNTLETSLDTAGSYISRLDILYQFHACQPKEDKPLKAYFTKLSNYHTHLDHIDNAITDRNFSTQIFPFLPSQYALILVVLKLRRALPTPKEAMHDLLEEDSTTGLTKELGDTSTWAAHYSQHSSYCCRGRGRGNRRGGPGGPGGRGVSGGSGGSGGSGDSHKSKCTYCKSDRHTTDACRKQKHAQEGGNSGENNMRSCYQ